MHSRNISSPTLKQRVLGTCALHIPNVRDEAMAEHIKALERYKVRNLAPLDPEDIAILPTHLQPHIEELAHLYEDYGIPHLDPERVIFINSGDRAITQVILEERSRIRRILGHMTPTPTHIEAFYNSPRIDKIAEALDLPTRRTSQDTERINDKSIVQAELHKNNVSTLQGKLVHSLEEAVHVGENLRRQGYTEVGFKIIRSVAGMGVFHISIEEIPTYAKLYGKNVQEEGVLIDGWITDQTSSPSVTYYIGTNPEEDILLGCADQLLSGTSHRGNVSNFSLFEDLPTLQKDVEAIRTWVRSQKGYGINGFDFVLGQKNGQVQHYLTEINGRMTGPTPGMLIAEKITGNNVEKPWGIDNTIPVPAGTPTRVFVKTLERSGLAYNPETQEGILPTNTAAIESHGKAMVLCIAHTQDEVHKELKAVRELFL